jgi:hypothetical protein
MHHRIDARGLPLIARRYDTLLHRIMMHAMAMHIMGSRARAVYVNACLINHRIFIHFLVRLAFRPSGGAPNAAQLATTIASSSTTLAPTPRRQRLTTVGGWCDPIIQPFLSRSVAKRFSFQAFLWHKNA